MDLYFNNGDPLNALLRDERKRTLYLVDTPFAFVDKVTTLTKYAYDNAGRMDHGRVVARFEWHVFSDTRFEFEGQWYTAKVFLQKHSRGR